MFGEGGGGGGGGAGLPARAPPRLPHPPTRPPTRPPAHTLAHPPTSTHPPTPTDPRTHAGTARATAWAPHSTCMRAPRASAAGGRGGGVLACVCAPASTRARTRAPNSLPHTHNTPPIHTHTSPPRPLRAGFRNTQPLLPPPSQPPSHPHTHPMHAGFGTPRPCSPTWCAPTSLGTTRTAPLACASRTCLWWWRLRRPLGELGVCVVKGGGGGGASRTCLWWWRLRRLLSELGVCWLGYVVLVGGVQVGLRGRLPPLHTTHSHRTPTHPQTPHPPTPTHTLTHPTHSPTHAGLGGRATTLVPA